MKEIRLTPNDLEIYREWYTLMVRIPLDDPAEMWAAMMGEPWLDAMFVVSAHGGSKESYWNIRVAEMIPVPGKEEPEESELIDETKTLLPTDTPDEELVAILTCARDLASRALGAGLVPAEYVAERFSMIRPGWRGDPAIEKEIAEHKEWARDFYQKATRKRSS